DSVAHPDNRAFLQSSDGHASKTSAENPGPATPPRRRRSEISDHRCTGLAVCALVLLGGPLAAADKVDVIHLTNGDRLTCEIKALDRSVLTSRTYPLAKASVHWGVIAT